MRAAGGEATATRWSAVVPTLGRSRWLGPCLEALRREGGDALEILVVSQGGAVLAEPVRALADRVLTLPENAGFARANNLALAAARGELLLLVNDDVIVLPGWLPALVAELAEHPQAAAVQGVQLQRDDPATIDGCGVTWNRWWQAVQLGRGRPAAALPTVSVEVFGVSATAAVYRREALMEVGGEGLAVFDERLFAYYEDVDLACRLRAAGRSSRLVPAARALHAGSVTGRTLRRGGRPWIYGNRLLVLARLLGRAFWPRLPLILLRDLLDLSRGAVRGERDALGVVAGWGRALTYGAQFLRFGPPAVPLAELRRFRSDRLSSTWEPAP